MAPQEPDVEIVGLLLVVRIFKLQGLIYGRTAPNRGNTPLSKARRASGFSQLMPSQFSCRASSERIMIVEGPFAGPEVSILGEEIGKPTP